MIVPEDSLWRRMPAIVEPTQRLRIEALVYSLDIIDCSLNSLSALTQKYGPVSQKLEALDRAQMFLSCHAIIEQLHTIRLVIISLVHNDPGPEQNKFLSKYESARSIRNRLSHLNQNIENLSRSKLGYTLFGSFGFFFAGDWNAEIDENGNFVRGHLNFIQSTQTSPDQTGSVSLQVSWTDTRSGLLTYAFSAFGETVDLTDLAKDLSNLIDPLRDDVTSQLELALLNMEVSTGRPWRQVVPVMPNVYARIELRWPASHRQTIALP